FWKQLKKPFFVLAPMADVTDMAFRQIIVDCGRSTGLTVNKPDVLYTEFVSASGLYSEKGKPKLLPHLKFGENERPIVAQLFGSVPKHFYEIAKLVVELGFVGVDINMGCPAGKIVKQDSGSGLILNPALAQEIIRETKRGIESTGKSIPVSIKTRIGYDSIITEEWISKIIETKPDAIIVHGRTMKEASKVPAHWDEIEKAGKLCREAGIPIIGNGDVMSYVEGIEKAKQYNLDGIMVGRGVFHNPWFFNPSVDPATKTPEERIALLKKHIENFIELWGTTKSFNVMKRFIKIYINDFRGAKDLREKLMNMKNPYDIIKFISDTEYTIAK
ncbi:MAG: tRNA-dihydrouridine synthase family protein, partial [bacterium]|nr:tRNA-dihydrouridine synthase family protein [bacterium]